ncbi:MAG: PadR family transcriptional regulator [bacterium]|nr:PadR family transcriptional regulator [bacterium]
MKYLTLNEEVLLLTIWRLREEAYGVTIRDEYTRATQKNIVMGTMYNSLDYLVKKGFVITEKGEPTAERGGRSKIYYRVTKTGLEALKKAKELHDSVWETIPGSIFEKIER